MKIRILSSLTIVTLQLATVRAEAQQATPAVPIRPIGPLLATTTDSVGNIIGIHGLSDGRVLVNDTRLHRVLLYDSTLARAIVVADAVSGTAKAYGPNPATIIPFSGDSTLFVDLGSLSLLLIDPSGRIGRVISVPSAADTRYLTSDAAYAGTDRQGHDFLLYSKVFVPRQNGVVSIATASATSRDSAFILRADILTHRLDTIATIRLDGSSRTMSVDANGKTTFGQLINPLPQVDDWVVTADGSLAVIRGNDLHIDWIHPDGAHASTPHIPYTWQRLTDSAKTAVIDSVNAFQAAQQKSLEATFKGSGVTPPPPPRFVDPSALPDYRPAFNRFSGSTAAKADAEGNIWIELIQPPPVRGGRVYDIINGGGTLIDRVQLLPGFGLVGFGPGVAYLTSRNGPGGASVLSRVRIH